MAARNELKVEIRETIKLSQDTDYNSLTVSKPLTLDINIIFFSTFSPCYKRSKSLNSVISFLQIPASMIVLFVNLEHCAL